MESQTAPYREHNRTALTKAAIKNDLLNNLYFMQGKFPTLATKTDYYLALAYSVHDRMLHRWISSAATYTEQGSRTVCYLSAEFLMGPHLGNNLVNMGIFDVVREVVNELDLGVDLDELMAQEEEPGLGNGGLGRLAACFIESLATLDIPALGYGIRYEFGIFEQAIVDGKVLGLASQPVVLGKVLGIVYRVIATHLTRKAGYTKAISKTGAVTLIQCFGGALNLNIHYHLLFLDGVYIDSAYNSQLRFGCVKAPTGAELTHLTHTIAHRVARYLERQSLLERDGEHAYLTASGVDEDPDSPMKQLLGSSITYRIAVGPQQGRKVFTLQTLPDVESDNPLSNSVGETAGFSLHAGVAAKTNERAKLERLCRYITRPAVSTKRLSLTRNGQVRYELKTPWRNGTTHVIFEPLNFMFRTNGMSRAHGCAGATFARLVSLVPKPRVNLTRFHGVFAPNSKYQARVTPARRGKCKENQSPDESNRTPAEKGVSKTWAKRLKRVFNIDINTCDQWLFLVRGQYGSFRPAVGGGWKLTGKRAKRGLHNIANAVNRDELTNVLASCDVQYM